MGQLLTLLPLTNHQCKMGTRPNEGGGLPKKKFNGQQAEERSAGFWNRRSMGGWGKKKKRDEVGRHQTRLNLLVCFCPDFDQCKR